MNVRPDLTGASYVEVDLVEVAVGMEDDIHIIQTSDLEGAGESGVLAAEK